jgi:hypothetical protein
MPVATSTSAHPLLTVNTPSDLVDRWIVTEDDGHEVVSFVSAAARHYLRNGSDITEVAVTNTDSALVWLEPTPGLFTREGRRPVVVLTEGGVQLASPKQIARWISSARAADEYDVRSGFRQPLAYLFSAAVGAIITMIVLTLNVDRWWVVASGTAAFTLGMLGAAFFISLRRRFASTAFDTDTARWARAQVTQLELLGADS